jgi:hypothetical protein
MATSIQVEESTLEMLKGMKSETRVKSYDRVIIGLLRERRAKSMYGFLPKGDLRGLRDKSDRF